LNLLRGTGVKGLTGIKKVNGNIIRPILNISRKSISEYVEQKGVSYRDDKTNFESHYSRNRLRNIIFPEFKKINPSFLNTITRNTSYLNQVAEVLEDLYKSKEGTLFENKGDETTIIIDELKKERHPSFWLFSILEQKGFNSSQLSQVLLAIDGQSGKVFISSTHQLVIDRGEIKVYPIENESDYILSITEPGFYSFKGISFKLDLFVPDEDFKPIPQYGELYFDAEKIKFPIVCRSWKAADRFRPFGMEKGFKKISDFYTDIKYSMREKNRQPILFDGEEIICLPGLRSDNRYRVTKKTRIIGEISELNYSPQS
jgi:tRNA(Ile)-lysidine synthase